MAGKKDLEQLFRQAKEHGFTIRSTGSGHYAIVAPDGEVTGSAKTPGSAASATSLRSWMYKHGLPRVPVKTARQGAVHAMESTRRQQRLLDARIAREHRAGLEAERRAVEAELAAKRARWSLTDAKRMLRQGYTVEHVARFTGWPAEKLSRRAGGGIRTP